MERLRLDGITKHFGAIRAASGASLALQAGGLVADIATDRTSPEEVTGLISGAIATSLAKTA